jgi:hypothetical protein
LHGRCDERIVELKKDKEYWKLEFEKKEEGWLQMFKDIYNLSRSPNFHKELEEKLDSFHQS